MKRDWGRGIRVGVLLVAVASAALGQRAPEGADDFGLLVENALRRQSPFLFGIDAPLEQPANETNYVPREIASASQRVLVAEGLQVEYLTRSVASRADMFVYWPTPSAYTHLVFCIEQSRSGTTPEGNGGLNAAIQRVDVATGGVETVLHGMDRCDGIRTTPWGTLVATEETFDGRAYEVLDPLGTTGHWVADRATGDVRTEIDGPWTSDRVAQRPALPTMAWEGLTVLGGGVVIAGDELRPGEASLDRDGGTIYKFIPDVPWAGGSLQNLDDSPFVAGRVYAMSISCRPDSHPAFPQYGQGCEVGQGAWVRVGASSARADADARGATGYSRPEDLHRDPVYQGEGVRFCWTNTGNKNAQHYGEILCAVDPTPLPANPAEVVDLRTGWAYLGSDGSYALVRAQRVFEGGGRFNSVDNFHFQPGSGVLYVLEDAQYGEVFACLPDGADRDEAVDGCIGILSVVDPLAEPTGFEFDASGTTAYLVVMHGENPPGLRNFESNPVDGSTDDILKITGFKLPK